MAARELGGDGAQQHEQQRLRAHCHRYEPYSAAHGHERWPSCVASAVDKALQRVPEARQSATPPMMRRRRMLAFKMQLATQSTANMAAYLERRAVLARSPSAHAHELSRAMCEPEQGNHEEDDDDDECTMCCICLEKNRANDARRPVEALQCGHVFHRDCIRQWMRYRRCCPVDRLELADDDA